MSKVNIFSIFIIGMMVFSTFSCNNKEEIVSPSVSKVETLNVPAVIGTVSNETKLRGTAGYGLQILYARKYNTGEEMKYQSGWAPSPVLNKSSKWSFVYTSEKANEITSSVSSSICPTADLKLLMAKVCVEAANTLKTSLSQATSVTRSESLVAYQQCRYKVMVKYEYFTGTLVVTPPNGNGAGSVAPLSYPVYWKIPINTYATTEKRMTK